MLDQILYRLSLKSLYHGSGMADIFKADESLRDLGEILDLLEVVFANGTEQTLGLSRGGVVQNIGRCKELLGAALESLSIDETATDESAVNLQEDSEPEKKIRQLNIKTLMEQSSVEVPEMVPAEKIKKESISSRIRILPRVRMFDD